MPSPKKNKAPNESLRLLPSINKLLEKAELQQFARDHGSALAKQVTQRVVAEIRQTIIDGKPHGIAALVDRELSRGMVQARKSMLQRVINATGILLHTNFGRAPWDAALLDQVLKTVAGYTNLEYDLHTAGRGGRGRYVREALARLVQAEDALVVNNNAAAILLILFACAKGREVIVSRGELVQIGGGFRIPDILKQSGARLVEVGTTNITTLDDYRAAIRDKTAMMLKIHQSNFYQAGFVQQPNLAELAALKNESVLLVHDLGSGNLMEGGPRILDAEPHAAQSLRSGADLICFSGDKLLGACQAGIIAGPRALIQRLERHPLMRALRPDKFHIALLQEVLKLYELKHFDMIPYVKLAMQSRGMLKKRIESLIKKAALPAGLCRVIETSGQMGGGSLPGHSMPSLGLVFNVREPNAVASWFEQRDLPIIGFVAEDRFILDFLTIAPDEDPLILLALQDWQQARTKE
jgi:L-seryl-tRNA(Ser) seleniumtransferase